MSRSLAFIILAGLAGACSPSITGYSPNGGACEGDCGQDTDDDTDDNRPDDDTDDDGSGNGDDGGGIVVDQDGDEIDEVANCNSIDWKDYRDGADSYLAVGAPRATGSFWPHAQGIEDLSDEAPSDFVGWDLEGEFYSSTRICGVVFRWSGDFEAVRASITGCPGSRDLGNEPFGHESEGRDCSWPAEGETDPKAKLVVDTIAYLDGTWINPMADAWCWSGSDAGCGSHVIALRDDLEDEWDDKLYRGH